MKASFQNFLLSVAAIAAVYTLTQYIHFAKNAAPIAHHGGSGTELHYGEGNLQREHQGGGNSYYQHKSAGNLNLANQGGGEGNIDHQGDGNFSFAHNGGGGTVASYQVGNFIRSI